MDWNERISHPLTSPPARVGNSLSRVSNVSKIRCAIERLLAAYPGLEKGVTALVSSFRSFDSSS